MEVIGRFKGPVLAQQQGGLQNNLGLGVRTHTQQTENYFFGRLG